MRGRGEMGRNIFTGIILCVLFGLYFAVPSKADEIGIVQEKTNIVAVVDSSTSMQASDPDWKIPESLQMLVDMCPDSNIRLSLIIYGTEAETAFRDMPLSAENREELKKKIYSVIVEEGRYSRGQTDTGAALKLAQEILEEQKDQKNMVLLFTDGAINTDKNGRTSEMSRQEVDSFAVFAQNNNIVVNTIGLFSAYNGKENVVRAEEELAILKSKTGGVYQRVEKAGDIPDFVISLLSKTLDIWRITMDNAIEMEIGGEQAWQYGFTIADNYTDDITFILPDPIFQIKQIFIENKTANTGSMPAQVWEGCEWVSTRRYNGEPGYHILRLQHRQDMDWVGEYKITIVTDSESPPAASMFFVYDIKLHVEMNHTEIGVLQPVEVEIYLTTGDGYRVDAAEFLKTLKISLNIVNLKNMGVEVRQNALGEEGGSQEDTVSEKLQLINDSFRFVFIPERASDYQIEVRVSNDYFVRDGKTMKVTVFDQLDIVSSILTASPHKNEPLEVQAFLWQKDTHSKIKDAEFYRLSGLFVHFTNLSTNVQEDIEMQVIEDGSGMLGSFIPVDAGEYEAYVYSESRRENVSRMGEKVTFIIEDRPITVKTSALKKSGLLRSYFRGYYTGRKLIWNADDFFADPDGDSYKIDEIVLSGNGVISEFGNTVYYKTDHPEMFQMELTASDYSGNKEIVVLNIRILSEFEVIGLTVFLIVLSVFSLLSVIYLVCAWLMSKGEMKGMVLMEVALNGREVVNVGYNAKENPQLYPTARIGSYFIPLVNPVGIESPEYLLKEPLTLVSRIKPRVIQIRRLLRIFAECYAASGFGKDAVYDYMDACAQDIFNISELCGQNNGQLMRLRNIRKYPDSEHAFITDHKLRGLRSCTIHLPVHESTRNEAFVRSGSPYSVCGLRITLHFYPDNDRKSKIKAGK